MIDVQSRFSRRGGVCAIPPISQRRELDGARELLGENRRRFIPGRNSYTRVGLLKMTTALRLLACHRPTGSFYWVTDGWPTNQTKVFRKVFTLATTARRNPPLRALLPPPGGDWVGLKHLLLYAAFFGAYRRWPLFEGSRQVL